MSDHWISKALHWLTSAPNQHQLQTQAIALIYLSSINPYHNMIHFQLTNIKADLVSSWQCACRGHFGAFSKLKYKKGLKLWKKVPLRCDTPKWSITARSVRYWLLQSTWLDLSWRDPKAEISYQPGLSDIVNKWSINEISKCIEAAYIARDNFADVESAVINANYDLNRMVLTCARLRGCRSYLEGLLNLRHATI